MSNWISKFEIALQSDGVNALRPLSELVIADPNSVRYQPFARVVGKNGLGVEVEVGFPSAVWRWEWLPQTDIDTLQTFERQNVYVRTEIEIGVTRKFKYFAAFMQRLRLGEINRRVGFDALNDGLRQKRSVEIEFSQLVEETAIPDSFS